MATHLEDAQRLSNAPYQLGWLIRPLWPPQTWQVARTGIHPRFLLTNQQKGSVRSPVRVLVGISFIILCDLPK